MARTPIVTIPVDDTAFKRFHDLWTQYQAELGEQGDKWADVNENVSTLAGTFAVVTAAMENQSELLNRQAQAAKAQSDADKKRTTELKSQGKLEEDAERRRHKALETTRQIARNTADATLAMAKWTALGGAAGVVGGALGFWGLDKFVAGIGSTRREATGYGVSTGQMQSMDVHLQRYFDVHSLLENVAETVADPSRRQYFAAMGVNPAGKDTADLAAETATRAAQMFIAGHGNEGWAKGTGLLNFFSMDELRRMASEYQSGHLQSDIGAARKDWGPGGAFAMAGDISRGWQTFIVNLSRAGLALEDKLLIKLNALGYEGGPLDKVIGAFTNLAVTALDKIDFNAIASGLDKFAGFIGSGKFQADFKTFADDVGAVASKLVDALTMLDIIPSSGGASAPPGSVQAATGTVPRLTAGGRAMAGAGAAAIGLIGGPMAAIGLGGAGALGAGRPGSGVWEMGAQDFEGRNLTNWGWTPDQAAGVMSNIHSESWSNPFAKGDYDWTGTKWSAYGLGQWHKDRRAVYAAIFGHSMESVKDPQRAMAEQLEFYQAELSGRFPSSVPSALLRAAGEGQYAKAGRDLKLARNRYDAGFTVSDEFEKPGGGAYTAALRGLGAMSITVHLDNKTGGSPSVSANAGSR